MINSIDGKNYWFQSAQNFFLVTILKENCKQQKCDGLPCTEYLISSGESVGKASRENHIDKARKVYRYTLPGPSDLPRDGI